MKKKNTLAYSKKGDESLQRKLQCVLINVKVCRTKRKSLVQVLFTEVFENLLGVGEDLKERKVNERGGYGGVKGNLK